MNEVLLRASGSRRCSACAGVERSSLDNASIEKALRLAKRDRRDGESLARGDDTLRGMASGDTARLYHRLSSYSGDPRIDWPTPVDHPLVLQDFVPNDRPTFPEHHKRYRDNLPSVELP